MAFVDFIIKAKIAGYASGGENQVLKFDDGSNGFEFASGGYKYLDRYYGFNPFSGTEHIYGSDGSLIWKMNYFGEILEASSDPQRIYAFLREAMLSITPEYPFRGPAEFEKGVLVYQNQQKGMLHSFNGYETVFDSGKKVYYLHYHGGKMKKIP